MARGPLKTIRRALVYLTAVLVVLLADLVACGPVKHPPVYHFVCIVHNQSTGTDKVQVLWAIDGRYVGSQEHEIGPGQSATVIMGEIPPDLVEIRSTALSTAWGPPDWANAKQHQFHIGWPQGVVWVE